MLRVCWTDRVESLVMLVMVIVIGWPTRRVWSRYPLTVALIGDGLCQSVLVTSRDMLTPVAVG